MKTPITDKNSAKKDWGSSYQAKLSKVALQLRRGLPVARPTLTLNHPSSGLYSTPSIPSPMRPTRTGHCSLPK